MLSCSFSSTHRNQTPLLNPQTKYTMSTTDPEKHSSAPPDTITPASSTHFDDNYTLYKSSKDTPETDPAELKRVLRKIDYRIIPILFFTYMLQYLDKNSINFSSVYGLKKGTGLEGQDFAWLGESFSVSRRIT